MLPELSWLARTFGCLTLAAEQSGAAVFGARLRDIYAGTLILDQVLAELEREAILHALTATDGNRRKAAELLGIGERTLYDKLKKYGVD